MDGAPDRPVPGSAAAQRTAGVPVSLLQLLTKQDLVELVTHVVKDKPLAVAVCTRLACERLSTESLDARADRLLRKLLDAPADIAEHKVATTLELATDVAEHQLLEQALHGYLVCGEVLTLLAADTVQTDTRQRWLHLAARLDRLMLHSLREHVERTGALMLCEFLLDVLRRVEVWNDRLATDDAASPFKFSRAYATEELLRVLSTQPAGDGMQSDSETSSGSLSRSSSQVSAASLQKSFSELSTRSLDRTSAVPRPLQTVSTEPEPAVLTDALMSRCDTPPLRP